MSFFATLFPSAEQPARVAVFATPNGSTDIGAAAPAGDASDVHAAASSTTTAALADVPASTAPGRGTAGFVEHARVIRMGHAHG